MTPEIPKISLEEKEKRLKEIREKVEQFVDALGMPVDPGIKETVVFLITLGINTVASCEGHIDHGTGGPYIDITSEKVLELEEKLKGVTQKQEREKIVEEIRKAGLEEAKKVLKLLNEFYQGRKIEDYSQILILRQVIRGEYRLESIGIEFQEEIDIETKKERLQKYQKEIQEFTEFLRRKYFEN